MSKVCEKTRKDLSLNVGRQIMLGLDEYLLT